MRGRVAEHRLVVPDHSTLGMLTAVKVISYNLRKNRASSELATLVEQFNPDILCLQEADTSALPAELASLHSPDFCPSDESVRTTATVFTAAYRAAISLIEE